MVNASSGGQAAGGGARSLAPLAPLQSAPESAQSPPPSSASPVTLTAKQWVIPPRPKPGRKPAVDVPPSKRRAQNRAAQRAFRERRAQKVGELEGQMEELEREHETTLNTLETQKQQLERQLSESVLAYEGDLRRLEGEVIGWRARCSELEALLQRERKARDVSEQEIAVLKGQAVRLPRHKPSTVSSIAVDIPSASHSTSAYQTPEETALGCGNCTVEHCQCFEDVLNQDTAKLNVNSSAETLKRAHSPSANSAPSKRSKSGDEVALGLPTASTNNPDSFLPENNITGPMGESCGFCQDESTCYCAQLASNPVKTNDTASHLPSPPSDQPNHHPPSQGPTSDPTAHHGSAPKSCGGAGNCSQCRSNPQSTLFCKSLASVHKEMVDAPPLPIENTIRKIQTCAAGAACCRVSKVLSASLQRSGSDANELDFTTPSSSAQHCSSAAMSSVHGKIPTLSCADAFATLSRHPAYGRASRDLGEWLPQLTTVDPLSKAKKEPSSATTPVILPPLSETDKAAVQGRTAFEIEAASVMGVLRFFDRRFGKE